jgi:pimeloyl-ACP methyl ester carboxylesterase
MKTLLLPGLACDGALFRDQHAALAAAGHEVQVVDAHTRHPTLPAMAAALLAEHPGPLALAGSSMGGMLALEAWRQAPGRIVGLALLGTSARADTPELLRLRAEAITLFEQGRMDEVLRANVMFAFHPRHAADAELVGDYLAMVGRAGAGQLIAQNRAVMARADLRPWLPVIRCPMLVMVGEADALTPPEQSREIATAVPGATLELLPDCGHLLTWEQPARVSQALLQWLGRLQGPTRPSHT